MRKLNLIMVSYMVICLLSGQANASEKKASDNDEILQSSAMIRNRLERIIENKPLEDFIVTQNKENDSEELFDSSFHYNKVQPCLSAHLYFLFI